MLINSKSRRRYIRLMEINSGNSVTHGPHQVAQILISRSLSELFFSKSLRACSSIVFSVTGSLAHSSWPFLTREVFSAHLTEQPNTLVVSTETGLFCNKASIASRVFSSVGVLVGFSTLSIRPW